MDREFASAGLLADLRALTEAETAELAEHDARMAGSPVDEWQPFRLYIVRTEGGERVLDGYEHAVSGEHTLCGLRREDIFVMRHHFRPDRADACPSCRAAASGG